ncbi:helix-turn-helix domain-containing protein [Halomonas sp. YLB-10]|uniref:helix-turn-helix domain-containing protein n=1 Tax=Halomonas sp. YLB-10 TaxID=2483111 RepID=UPI0021AB2EB8|nr:helix-turn-helix domain-containing protein [Halomonas sp. YLB-10]
MNHCYRHLSAKNRGGIIMMRATHSIQAISTHLGRAPTTVSREIARHTVDLLKDYKPT